MANQDSNHVDRVPMAMIQRIAEIPEQIREKKPLVHMIPNSVIVSLCTDGLTALGARPLMAVAPEEMDEIPRYADAVVVNMGQPTCQKMEAAEKALLTAEEYGVPIIWDPVGAGASKFRCDGFQKLLSLKWKGIVKGNRSEVSALQSGVLSHQGIDSVGEFSLQMSPPDGRTWAVSGPQDLVFDETRNFRLGHGEKKLMLTGSGCLTGAVMGACYAVEHDPVPAALGACCIMACAGDEAAKYSGYGSQKQALLDALTGIDKKKLTEYVYRIRENL